MPETPNPEFEELWQRACREPDLKVVTPENQVVLELSIEQVLDRYITFAQKGVADNRISESKYQELLKKTNDYKKALYAIDDGSLMKEIKDLTDRFNPFR